MADEFRTVRFVAKSCAHLAKESDKRIGSHLEGEQFSTAEIVCSVSDFSSSNFHAWVTAHVLAHVRGDVTITISQ